MHILFHFQNFSILLGTFDFAHFTPFQEQLFFSEKNARFFTTLKFHTLPYQSAYLYIAWIFMHFPHISNSVNNFHIYQNFPHASITNKCSRTNILYHILPVKLWQINFLQVECLRVQIPIISHSTHQFTPICKLWNMKFSMFCITLILIMPYYSIHLHKLQYFFTKYFQKYFSKTYWQNQKNMLL